MYCLGEFGEELPKVLKVTQDEILNLMQNTVCRVTASEDVKTAALNALLKLFYKFDNSERIKSLI